MVVLDDDDDDDGETTTTTTFLASDHLNLRRSELGGGDPFFCVRLDDLSTTVPSDLPSAEISRTVSQSSTTAYFQSKGCGGTSKFAICGTKRDFVAQNIRQGSIFHILLRIANRVESQRTTKSECVTNEQCYRILEEMRNSARQNNDTE